MHFGRYKVGTTLNLSQIPNTFLWIRPAKANNNLYHYTQATLPHLRAGNVTLAFNAISPFEFGLANTWQKRLISRLFKSNATHNWLTTIGGFYKKEAYFYLTHWQNFKNERALLETQNRTFNDFGWNLLSKPDQLTANNDSSYIVNVIEGAHALQGEAFMRYLYAQETAASRSLLFNRNKFNKEKINVVKTLADKYPALNPEKRFPVQYQQVRTVTTDTLAVKSKKEITQLAATADTVWRRLALDELTAHIAELKSYRSYPTFMVTISHLAWNGMTGQALGLDTKGIGRILIKRFYRIKASDDKKLLGQWRGLFYSEPINTFGQTVIQDLLDTANGKRRILIDLKHSDYPTRKFFYDSVMTQQKAPPICSHCAVNGLKELYYSPFVDEYSLLKSSADSIFYPFGLNLYDEEITKIYTGKGMIGIPLEERVLGGFIKRARKKLIVNALNVLKQSRAYAPVFAEIDRYNRSEMGIDPSLSDKLFLEDYLSADPFLQNLFYIVDHSGEKGAQAWQHVCIGSDLDGIIDPIDICPTASQYPHFKTRLLQFMPLFLAIRKMNTPAANDYAFYFAGGAGSVTPKQAMDALFYDNLHQFIIKHFHI